MQQTHQKTSYCMAKSKSEIKKKIVIYNSYKRETKQNTEI